MRIAIAVAVASIAVHAAPPPQNAEGEQIFAARVKPLLAARCQTCHGPARAGGLSLETREGMLAGGKRGAAIVPGDAARSLMISALEQHGDLKMPPTAKLSDAEIAAVGRWIELGAPWPGAAALPPESSASDLWAFQPVRHYEPPPSGQAAVNPVDAFILHKLGQKRIPAAGRADRRTLLRRATFDLTGLPPSAAETEAFLHDPANERDAFGKLVERLLASPHYGERWGRHWLDVVRYADTGGYSNDFERPNAWRYRDYVIRSFNRDKPYDRFIREQIAGDELDPDNSECLVATGFLRMGPWEQTGMSVAAETRQAWLDDVTQITGTAFLGVTLECARCHDHKFDPLPTRDYYSLQAVFATTEFADRPAPFLTSELRPDFDEGRRSLEELVRRNEARLAEFDALIRTRLAARSGVTSADQLPRETVTRAIQKKDLLTGEEHERFKVYQKRKELYARSIRRYSPIAYSVSDGPFESRERAAWTPPDVFILPVGNLKNPGAKVEPEVLTAVARYAREPDPAISAGAISRRMTLANWIADSRNPFTARLMVNRIWQYHFGKGIAANPNNLGKMGKRPTHPELLDYLAEYFVQHGWSVKAMHRLVMLSDAYQRASLPAADSKILQKEDPENELLSYFSPRRLESEELRDAILAVTGELSPEGGGPGTFPEINRDVASQPQQIMGTLMPAYRPSPAREQRHRRTLYTFQKRNLVDPFLDVFNGPSLDASTERRTATTIPTQVYALLNSDFVRDMALAFADRIQRARGEPVRAAFRAVFGREPNQQELAVIAPRLEKLARWQRSNPPPAPPARKPLVRSITSELTGTEVTIEEDSYQGAYEENLQRADAAPHARALAAIILALFNTNEFVYVD